MNSPRILLWLMTIGYCLAPSGFSAAIQAAEWPQFRGPAGNGHAIDADIPLTWSETENVTWKIPVPGEGFSSPVISGDQLWLTTSEVEPLPEDQEQALLSKLKNPRGIQFGGPLTQRALCYDIKTGELLHDVVCFKFPSADAKHATNSYASPTPVLANGKLFCHFGTYGTCAIDTKTGQLLWKNQQFQIDHQNGPGSSPVAWGELVIVHYDGMDLQFIAAYDQATGDVVWKKDRSGELNPRPEFQKAYGTPIILNVNGSDQLISPAADWVYSYAPATGQELWKANYGKLGFSTVPKPVAGHGMIYVCTSFVKSRLLAIKYDGTGDVSDSHVAWYSDRQIPQKPSIMLVDDALYFTSDGGIANCLDAITGEIRWQERFPGQYSASPIYAAGRIYFFNLEGRTTVIEPGAELKILAENRLDGNFNASPAIADNALFLRTRTHLYRIEK